MATVTLSKDTTTVTLPAPELDGKFYAERLQAWGLAADGTAYVYDGGVERFRAAQIFRGLTATEKTALAEFFHAVKAMQESFTYTDADDEEYTARFATKVITLVKRAPDIWDVELELELVAAAG